MARALVGVLALVLMVLPLGLAGCSKSNESTGTEAPPVDTSAPPPGTPVNPPLTQADIEKYIALLVETYKNPKTEAGAKAAREKVGMTLEEYGRVWSQVKEAYRAIAANEKRGEPIPGYLQADVDMVKANRARLDLAKAGKPEALNK